MATRRTGKGKKTARRRRSVKPRGVRAPRRRLGRQDDALQVYERSSRGLDSHDQTRAAASPSARTSQARHRTNNARLEACGSPAAARINASRRAQDPPAPCAPDGRRRCPSALRSDDDRSCRAAAIQLRRIRALPLTRCESSCARLPASGFPPASSPAAILDCASESRNRFGRALPIDEHAAEASSARRASKG